MTVTAPAYDWVLHWWYWCAVGLFVVLWAVALAIATCDRVLIWRERRRWRAGR